MNYISFIPNYTRSPGVRMRVETLKEKQAFKFA